MVNYMEMPFRAEMVLNLTRTVATQAVRGFTHQTWVSGWHENRETITGISCRTPAH